MIIGGAAALSVMITLLIFTRLGFFDDRDETEIAGVQEQTPVARVVGRKNIYDRNYRELAVSFRLTSIYARPLEVVDIDGAAEAIAEVLEGDAEELQSLLKAERSFVWLGRQLPAKQAEKILGQDIPGIYGVDEMHRFYPHRQIAAPVLGFVKDDQGLAGVEFQYDNVLRGIAGKEADLASAGLSLPDGVDESGADLVLSLDLPLQTLMEKRLGQAMSKVKATTGIAVVMDSETGAVLAMGSLPAYDPNSFWDFSAIERRNRAVIDPVFPGGVGRLFATAASYELNGALPASTDEVSGEQWHLEAEGSFVSGNLARLPHVDANASGVSGFVSRLAIADGQGVDLPAEQSSGGGHQFSLDGVAASTSAINLLTAFARTVNGGIPVRPRLLAGVRSSQGLCSVAAEGKDGAEMFRAGMRERLVGILTGKGRSRKEVTFESRVSEQLVEEHFVAQGKNVYGETEVSEEDAVSGEVNGSGNEDRYYATMLGMTTGAGAKLVMVAALSGSRFDPAASSPLATMGREVLRKAAAISKAKQPEHAEMSSAGEEDFCEAWLKLQKQPGDSRMVTPSQKVGVMPDVSGSSLRRALQVLQPFGLPIRAEGSGRVVKQRPVAGASLQGMQEIVLTLQLEQ